MLLPPMRLLVNLVILDGVCIATLLKPTPQQLKYADQELGALVHFNMATYGRNCSDDPVHFNPTKLDTDQWVRSMVDFGAKQAVLTAKHNCGFLLWPSTAKMADGSTYNFTVASSQWRGGNGDVVRDFQKSCSKYGLGLGYYYSISANEYLDRRNVSEAEHASLVVQNLEELWGSKYGNNGNLTELWFDGGVSLPGVGPQVKDLVAKYQPQTVAGAAEYSRGNVSTLVTKNPLRWVGNEAGGGADPTWSFGPVPAHGNNSVVIWAPVEADTTLQLYDSWWYHEPSKGGPIGVRTLAELQTVYHSTVGQNAFLELDFAPTPEGLIAPDQAARYKEFGHWIRTCYEGVGVMGKIEHPLGGTPSANTQLLTFGNRTVTIDRVVVREDQTEGQAIRAWEVHAQTQQGSQWSRIANGTSMGNKWIKLLDQNISVTALKTVVTATSAGTTAKLRSLSAHRCSRATTYAQCTLKSNFAAGGAGNHTQLLGDAKTIDECCDACNSDHTCRLFVALPQPIDGHTCMLYTGFNASADQVINGAISGSPQRTVAASFRRGTSFTSAG